MFFQKNDKLTCGHKIVFSYSKFSKMMTFKLVPNIKRNAKPPVTMTIFNLNIPRRK